MKKTYSAPAVTSCGDAVRNTKGVGPTREFDLGEPAAAGRVGFYL